jgi:hypothetical protein
VAPTVAQRNHVRYPPARGNLTVESHDQRDVEQGVVKAVAMGPQPPLPKVLAVIRRDDHHGVLQVSPSFQLVEKAAEILVQVRQLGVVEISRVRIFRVFDKTFPELGNRVIRVVGVEIVQEDEIGMAAVALRAPFEKLIGDGRSGLGGAAAP